MYSVSLVCLVMYWKIGQFYKDSETAGYKGICYYIIFYSSRHNQRLVLYISDQVRYWQKIKTWGLNIPPNRVP